MSQEVNQSNLREAMNGREPTNGTDLPSASVRPMITTANLPKLDGSNFASWSDMITIHLKLRGLADATTNDVVDEIVDLQAKLVLLETMDESHRGQVRGCNTAKEMMQRLKLVYADKGAANIVRLMYEYYGLKKDPRDSVSVHIGKMDAMRRSLAEIGEEQSERLYQVHLIRSLPKEYYSILELWELTHKDMQTTSNLVSRLLKKETDLKAIGDDDEQAMAMRRPQSRQYNSNMSYEERKRIVEERKKTTRCNNCGQRGHWAAECSANRRQTANVITEVNFQMGGEWKDQWLLDSGATSHMSSKMEWFSELEMYKQPSKCMAGDGFGLKVIGEGKIRARAKTDMGYIIITLNKVLYIPELASNLISVGAAAQQGIETIFKKDLCVMKKDGNQLAQGMKSGGIYIMDLETQVKKQATNLIARRKSLSDWHKIMGHASEGKLRILLEQVGISVEKDSQIRCAACPGGKAKHAPHPGIDRTTTEPGVIHTDVVHVSNKSSLEGYKYYLLCKDEASEFVMVFPIRSKNEVPSKLAYMAIEFENMSGYRVREMKSDNGTEFINKVVKIWCLKERVYHTTSAPYTPQQNGMAEREVRTVTEMARTLLVASKLSTELWPEAVLTAAYLKNRLPTTRSHQTPFERLINRKPVIGHLREFGAPVQVLRNSEYLTKLDTKTDNGYLVGFTGRSNTYKVYIPSKGKVITTSDVCFVEHERPTPEVTEEPSTGEQNPAVVRMPQAERVSTTNRANEISEDIRENENANAYEGGYPMSSTPTDGRIGRNGRPYIRTEELENFFGETVNRQAEQMRLSEESGRERSENIDRVGAQSDNMNRNSSTNALDHELQEPNGANQTFEVQVSNDANEMVELHRPNNANETFEVQMPNNANETFAVQVPNNANEMVELQRPNNANETFELQRPNNANETFDVRMLNNANETFEPQRPNNANTIINVQAASDENQSTSRSIEPSNHEMDGAPTPPPRSSSLCNCVIGESLPKDYREAINGPDNRKWQEAVESELRAHELNHTWDIVDRPSTGVALTTKWVFTLKKDNNGKIERYKARLVARGFEQRYGVDYGETFSPVVGIESVRALIALSAAKDWKITQFDISTAFLNGKVEEEIYVEAPSGIETQPGKCLKLVKALYGLKQAPRCWSSAFNEALMAIGLVQLESDRCIYLDKQRKTIVVVYVDDGLVLSGKDGEGERVILELNKKFEVKTLRGDNFIGLQIERTSSGIVIHQERYAREILKRFKMDDAVAVSTPIVELQTLIDAKTNKSKQTTAPYREAIGCLQYLASRTRPDLLFTINFLSRFSNDPKDVHWTGVKRALKYLKGSVGRGIKYEYNCASSITTYADADWAGDTTDRLSTSGVITLVAGGPVVFSSTKQTSVARSTCEAEYVALSQAARDTKWLKQLFEELEIETATPKIKSDNRGAIAIAGSSETSKKTKHIDIHYHFVRRLVEQKKVELEFVEGENQLADYLTKPITAPRLEKLVEKSNMTTGKHVAKALLLVLSLITVTTAFERVGRTIFLQDTDHQVYTGIEKGKIAYSYYIPCSADVQGKEWDSSHDVQRKSFAKFKGECNREINVTISPVLQRMEECLPSNRNRARRIKRFEPITTTLLTTAVAVGGGGTAMYSWLSADSSYNRLNQKDIIDKNQTEAIDQLRTMFGEHQMMLEKAKEIRNDTLKVVSDHSRQISENRLAIVHLAEISPYYSWRSASIHYVIKADQAYLTAVEDSCKKERLATNAMYKLSGISKFNEWEESDTYVESMTKLDPLAFEMVYHVFIKSIDTKIYEVADFKIWEDITEVPKLSIYTGPQYALHNKTSNCTLGLDEVKKGKVYMNCTLENYRDPRLDEFKNPNVDRSTAMNLTKPTVYQNHAGSYIYCFNYRIVIENKSLQCPHYPFYLPITASFTLMNRTHEVVSSSPILLRGYVDPLTYTTSLKTKDEILEDTNIALSGIFLKNYNSTEKKGEAEKHPMIGNFWELYVAGSVGVMLLSGGLTALLIWCCTRKGQGVTTNIYNTVEERSVPQTTGSAPPLPMRAQYYPEIRSQYKNVYNQGVYSVAN